MTARVELFKSITDEVYNENKELRKRVKELEIQDEKTKTQVDELIQELSEAKAKLAEAESKLTEVSTVTQKAKKALEHIEKISEGCTNFLTYPSPFSKQWDDYTKNKEKHLKDLKDRFNKVRTNSRQETINARRKKDTTTSTFESNVFGSFDRATTPFELKVKINN